MFLACKQILWFINFLLHTLFYSFLVEYHLEHERTWYSIKIHIRGPFSGNEFLLLPVTVLCNYGEVF